MALIYIVEDDESIALVIQATLEAAAHEAVWLFEARALDAALSERRPDLILLDIMLPEKDGFEILAELKADAELRDIPVIILSAKGDEADKVRGLDGGAEDYVAKPFGVRELQARVNAALRRRGKPSDQPIAIKDLLIDEGAKEVRKDGAAVRLTRKEMELLVYLARNAGRVISREQLLERVWDYHYEGDTTRTVDFHIRSLRTKLKDDAGDSKYIETVRGYGYRFLKER